MIAWYAAASASVCCHQRHLAAAHSRRAMILSASFMSIPRLVRGWGYRAGEPQVRGRITGALLVGSIRVLQIFHGRFMLWRHQLARCGAISILRNHRAFYRASVVCAELSKLRARHLGHSRGTLSLDQQITRAGNQPS